MNHRQESDKAKKETQIVGNIGMYYACYKLSTLGWNVMPTARNARGIDIIAYDPNGEFFKGVQVKALSKKNPVPLGNSIEKIMGDWWIIVVGVGDEKSAPDTYILHPSEVRKLASQSKITKDGKPAFWLQPKDYMKNEFREQWIRINELQ